jgi:L-ascorbate metabolism protein UlaG (beta-lactamase superfamily)
MPNYPFSFLLSRLTAIGILSVFSLTCSAQTDRPADFHRPKDGFQNIYHRREKNFFDFLKWRWKRISKKIPPPESYSFPLGENNPAFLKSNRSRNTLTWVGHATILLQLNGRNILTDPHFSKRASPVQWAGPQRVVQPGISLEDLPSIDFVFISHDHYDSLDKLTIQRLHEREGGENTLFFVPLGLEKWFQKLGVRRVIELDWWMQHVEQDFTITAVPVHHWSKRSIFSRNQTLWSGWVIQAPDFCFCFVGDTGYSPIFNDIGRKLGPFDVSAIPIGAYEPRWFMQDHHINPEEAVQVHLDLKSRKSVAIHWGTFILTDEPLDEPPERLKSAVEKRQLVKDSFLVLKHGETIFLKP